MSKCDLIEFVGVVSHFSRGVFTVITEENTKILATLGGKIKKHNITIIEGDKIKVSVSPYDMTKGIITYRILKNSDKINEISDKKSNYRN